MVKTSDLATPALIDSWLRDMALTPTQRADANNTWALEFTVPGATPLIMRAVRPIRLPRAVMLVCGMSAAPEQVTAFSSLSEEGRKVFWQQLRSTLNREYIEFQIEGAALVECPSMITVTAIRYDDGLTLDSFARTLASVIKASFDVMFFLS